MQDCYAGMRAALARNIEGLTHLTDGQREVLLDSEMARAINATEAGQPFVEIYGPENPDTGMAEDSEDATPAPRRVAPVKILHA